MKNNNYQEIWEKFKDEKINQDLKLKNIFDIYFPVWLCRQAITVENQIEVDRFSRILLEYAKGSEVSKEDLCDFLGISHNDFTLLQIDYLLKNDFLTKIEKKGQVFYKTTKEGMRFLDKKAHVQQFNEIEFTYHYSEKYFSKSLLRHIELNEEDERATFISSPTKNIEKKENAILKHENKPTIRKIKKADFTNFFNQENPDKIFYDFAERRIEAHKHSVHFLLLNYENENGDKFAMEIRHSKKTQNYFKEHDFERKMSTIITDKRKKEPSFWEELIANISYDKNFANSIVTSQELVTNVNASDDAEPFDNEGIVNEDLEMKKKEELKTTYKKKKKMIKEYAKRFLTNFLEVSKNFITSIKYPKKLQKISLKRQLVFLGLVIASTFVYFGFLNFHVEKIYFDKNWRRCKQSEASYYRIIKTNLKHPDKPIGLVKDYYISGELQWKGRIIQLESFVKDGMTRRYYKNGQKKDEEPYKNGKLHGTFTSWYENGNIKQKGKYIAEEKEDRWEYFYENGNIKQKGKYVAGEKESKWEYFHENGKLWQRAIYNNGKLADRTFEECDEFSNCKQVVHEDFTGDNCEENWDLANKDNYQITIKKPDGLLMNLQQDKHYVFSLTQIPLNNSKNFSISSKAFLRDYGFFQNPQYGLVWDYQDRNNYSAFLIDSRGYFTVRQIEEGVELETSGWIDSKHINRGKAENTLVILRKNNALHFSVNGKVIYEKKFSLLKASKFGFIAGFSQNVLFKNLIIKQDTELENYSEAQKNTKTDSEQSKNLFASEANNSLKVFFRNLKEDFHQQGKKIKSEITNFSKQIKDFTLKITGNEKTEKEETIYYDEDWNECEKDKCDVAYYRIMTIDSKRPTKPVGIVKDYYSTGELQWEGQISFLDLNSIKEKNDMKVGISTHYYKSGKKVISSQYKNGKLDGSYTKWLPSGKIEYEGSYVNGKKEGEWRFYHENGKIKEQGKYINDERQGEWRFWLFDGKLEKKGSYSLGKQFGKWRTYNEDGFTETDYTKTGEQKEGYYRKCNNNNFCKKVFEEDFSNNSKNWEEDNTEDYKMIIQNETLIINSKNDQYKIQNSIPVPFELDIKQSFMLETKADSSSDKWNYGLVWNFIDWNNYSYFTINSKGKYRVHEIANGKTIEDTDWQENDNINILNWWNWWSSSKKKFTNKISLVKIENKTYFLINDKTVYSKPFRHFSNTKIGVITMQKQTTSFNYLYLQQDEK